MTVPRYTPLAASLSATSPFVGPETQERATGKLFQARLGANENGFGPSPKALDVIQQAATEVWKYADPECHDLRHALAQNHKCDLHNISVGEGIDGLLGTLVRLLIGPGDVAVTSLGAYPTFNYHVAGCGGSLETVAYKDDCEDLLALIERAKSTGAKLIYFANPDNPMGSYLKGEHIVAALDHLPTGTLLILDEAYIECAPTDALCDIAFEDPRVIRMRTFSKAHGLAGLRIGYALGHPDLIAAFNKIRNHFGVNLLAQKAALAALQDPDWLAHIQRELKDARQFIYEVAQSNGLTALPSATNFVAIDCGRDEAFAKEVLEALIAQGVFVRMPFAAPQNRCIRVSCAPRVVLEKFASALPSALAQARRAHPV
ncbi:histidinol-phosphate aminotransferase [Epibacterium ulvae]|uniref:Histidinol-phosphate aminotransferase n=1 Tax=Epibacterium ulvae TaxID=1156985 RepID=A0A1G5PVF9_9RHOB|nr:pyridoxal phosphate-dependent aminotransferase [Epibacterium ulvae]SCZ53412.1 histidinol-phosphate aminotransferase [Epibacterium ulvae]